MNAKMLLKFSEQLTTAIKFICKNLSGDPDVFRKVSEASVGIYNNISQAISFEDPAEGLLEFKTAQKQCIEVEKCLEILYLTKIISEETYKNLRNISVKIERTLIVFCATIERKQRKQK